MKKVAVITVARSDFGIYLPILRRLKSSPRIALEIFAGGAHLSARHGLTAAEIERQGYEIAEKIQMLADSDAPEGIGISLGMAVMNCSQVYQRRRPDLVLLLGDRFEMFAAAAAALPFNIPLAHIHGGELTLGAIDDAIRHSITKMSHLHFVAAADYQRRVIQLGEEPWRVKLVGAPSLDNLSEYRQWTQAELEELLNCKIGNAPFLVTFHPVTTEFESAPSQTKGLLEALSTFSESTTMIITKPNADTNSHAVLREIEDFVARRANTALVDSLGMEVFFSLMKIAGVMVGNSSSGLIEAPAFGLPVVNIGRRQEGRMRCSNVIDTTNDPEEIRKALVLAQSSAFREKIKQDKNPFYFGGAAKIIADTIEGLEINERLKRKAFHDLAF